MRFVVIALCLSLAIAAGAMAPRAACWRAGGVTYLAALDRGHMHLARVEGKMPREIAVLPGAGLMTLVVGAWRGQPVLLAARGRVLLRFAPATRHWMPLGTAPAPIREILPLPQAARGALLLTGTPGDPVPADGAVYSAGWRRRFTCVRLTAVKAIFRPWQLCWTRTRDEQRIAAACYKSTYFVPVKHNCMFVFSWQRRAAKARWLGSRLSRPYIDATHADLRADGNWRMVAVEVTRDGGHALGVYHPIGFGYEGEWRQADPLSGLQHVAAYSNIVLCFGEDAGGRWARQLLPDGEQYRLQTLPEAPPSPEGVARVDATHLAGWWKAAWHMIPVNKS